MSIAQVRQYMVEGDGDAAVALVKELIEKGTPAKDIMAGLTEEMGVLGQKFENFEVFLPDLMIAGDAFMQIMSVLKEHLVTASEGEAKTVIIGTVKGDYHDIGKNIVKTLLENYGFDVIDLGKDVDYQDVVDAAIKYDVRLVGLSALMTTTLKSMENTIKLLHENNVNCKIVVGGAVLTPDYAEKIGADFYARDAKETVDIARKVYGAQD